MSASKKFNSIEASKQEAEEEAHESDVLEDSSDEESEHGGEDISSDKGKMVDDANEEEYGNFLRSCFCNEEDAYSLLSFNDEDEDQDYQPPSRKDGYDNDDEDEDEDEDDDDDDGEDDGLVKVAQTELVDLVDGCWQTITGASLTFLDREPPSMVDQSSRGSSKRDYSEFSESEYGNMAASSAVEGNKRLRSKATRRDAQVVGTHVRVPMNTSGALQASSSQTHDAAKSNNNNSVAGGVTTAATAAATGGMNVPARNGSRNASSNSLISSLVRQIFSGEKPSALCVDGMPVEAIRKLVARQMSMASQLLIQMLMMAEDQDRAGCFNSCYTSLMELSNHRESSLRKASLLQMSLKNLLGSAQQVSSSSMVRRNSSSSSSFSSSFLPGTAAGFDGDDSDGSPAEMRVTRAAAGRLYKSGGAGGGQGGGGDPDAQDSRNGVGGGTGRERQATRVSVFDLPLLSNITELFEAIDVSRQEIALQVATVEEGDSVAVSHRSLSSAAARDMEVDLSFRKRCKALLALRCQMQHIARSVPAATMAGQSNKTRLWSCLLPSSSFPLGEDILRNTCRAGPCSLQGRSVFTPAEDDLLLRGIMKHGDGDQQRPGQPSCWALIKTQFLPSKEEQLLQFRFRQMTAPTAKDDSKFKRYMTLDKTLPGGILVGLNSWSRDEDLDLLRGFQIYGNKWPLIAVFFFPHKCRKELKNRWTMIQRYWERSFSGRLERITFDTQLPSTSQTFLRFLKASSIQSVSSPFPSPHKLSSTHVQPPSSSSSSSSARDVFASGANTSDAVALATLATVAANSPPSRLVAGMRPLKKQGEGTGGGQVLLNIKAKKENVTTSTQPSTEIRAQRQPTTTSGSSSSKRCSGASLLAATGSSKKLQHEHHRPDISSLLGTEESFSFGNVSNATHLLQDTKAKATTRAIHDGNAAAPVTTGKTGSSRIGRNSSSTGSNPGTDMRSSSTAAASGLFAAVTGSRNPPHSLC